MLQKMYVLGPKSQKFPTAENTRYTVYRYKSLHSFHMLVVYIYMYVCILRKLLKNYPLTHIYAF